jgi:DNA (cytosine-5)-methyltransferase 1
MDVSTVDLFCGVGGLTCGLEAAGVPVDAGIDLDVQCRHPYETNNDATFRGGVDLRELARRDPERVAQLFDRRTDVRVLAGCPPCQPFSTLTGRGGEDHDDWALLHSFDRLIEYVEPEVVVMENVLEVTNHDPYEEFAESLKDRGYSLNPRENRTVYCPEYGIPQKRKRTVLLAAKDGPIALPEPPYTDESEYPTVRETIDDLPAIEAGETHPDDPLHQARSLSETNLERIRISEPGETWEDWPEKGREDLLLECHKKASGSSYTAPYGRIRPDEPAPTMTTQFYNYGSGRFGHYDTDQDRALSLREGALLQTFPRDYDFLDGPADAGVNKLGEWIGNAVPPTLGEYVGRAIAEYVGADKGVLAASEAD